MKSSIYNINDHVVFRIPGYMGMHSGIIVRKFLAKIDGAYGKYDYMFDIRTNPLDVCKNIPKENIIKKFPNVTDVSKCDKEKEESIMDLTPVKVIYNRYATIVFWKDGTKTVVKVSKDDTPSYYNGFCAALAKKVFETNSAVRKIVNEGFDEVKEKKVKDIEGKWFKVKKNEGGNLGVVPSPPKKEPETCNGCEFRVHLKGDLSYCRLVDTAKPFIKDGDGIPEYCPLITGEK